jgi:hypothetical protein
MSDKATRYEQIMGRRARGSDDIASAFAAASHAARAAVPANNGREVAIRDVAAGVAGPALIGFVLWLFEQTRLRKLSRLRFLSRDGQVLYELSRRLAPALAPELDLEYVYSSRVTWSLAATDPTRLHTADWLFNSFMKSNAHDVCARLGLPFDTYRDSLISADVSLDPDVRADNVNQRAALQAFLRRTDVVSAAAERISAMRGLVTDYAKQHQLTATDTGLVDAGWTGRMIGSLITVCEDAGQPRPHALLWGHEPRTSGWTDPDRVAGYLYNTATGAGLKWRVPDAPFLIETFCMADHGIVTGYQRTSTGAVEPVLQAIDNPAIQDWGLALYRAALYAFCAAFPVPTTGDARPVIHAVMDAFWNHRTRIEAQTWGSYPYDSDPTGTAARHLARPITANDIVGAVAHRRLARADRAWLAGSAALSGPLGKAAHAGFATREDRSGQPATD